MTAENDLFARLRAALDRDAAIDLFRGAIRHDSITGNEANVGRMSPPISLRRCAR
jgi:acetylornithine deacetylase